MTGPQKKKKHHVGDTFYKRKYKTKYRARDIDEVTIIFKTVAFTRTLNSGGCGYIVHKMSHMRLRFTYPI